MADTTQETLGEVIRQARTKLDIRLRELARRLEKTPSYLSDIENDRRVPAEDVLRGISSELRLDFERLMELAGRFGSDAEGYLRRTPAATTLFRRIQEQNLSEEEVRRLIADVDKLRGRRKTNK